ncbi:MAG TPA: GNAT family N-acetyltransferase [Gaiellaceae bacterium]|nr:GNAT family N-acetyltransferase [Gaiellaceae bacterium]
MPFEVRPTCDLEEFGRAIFGIAQYFGAAPDEERLGRFARVLELERMHAAWENGAIVGGAGAFTFDFSVPGASLPCAGVTVVGVYPAHRRRGVLRAMMDAQLRDVHERGEPIAALWASEETIYGRFGYGLASWCGEVKIKKEWSAFARPLERRGTMRSVSQEEARTLFPPVWEALRAQRPGVFARSQDWWELRPLRLPDEEKESPRRFFALELDGAPQGYAIYRTHVGFENGVSTARTEVLEAVGATPQATGEVWRFLLDIDWTATFEAALLPPDHPLFLLLANPRRAGYRMGDGLWVRLVDVGAALSGRTYSSDGSLVFDVRDPVCPWNEGGWKLEGASASRTDDPAELALEVDALGSAYLGAVSFTQLAGSGRVEELVDGALKRADALFGWQPLPWCPEIF